MMKTLLITCLLLVLLPPVASLTCQACSGQGRNCRNPIIEECDASSNQSCMSALAKGRLSASGSQFVLKSCINSELCDADYATISATSSVYLQGKISCCQEDMCNVGPPEVPELEKRQKNGLKCPSCFNIFSDECESNETVNCRNEENYCFYYGGRVQFGGIFLQASVRGCASASACDLADGLQDVGTELLGLEITQSECSEADNTVPDL